MIKCLYFAASFPMLPFSFAGSGSSNTTAMKVSVYEEDTVQFCPTTYSLTVTTRTTQDRFKCQATEWCSLPTTRIRESTTFEVVYNTSNFASCPVSFVSHVIYDFAKPFDPQHLPV